MIDSQNLMNKFPPTSREEKNDEHESKERYILIEKLKKSNCEWLGTASGFDFRNSRKVYGGAGWWRNTSADENDFAVILQWMVRGFFKKNIKQTIVSLKH